LNPAAPARGSLGRAAAPLTALVVLAIGLAIIDALPVGVFYDDAMYVVLAKALATGHGYHWLNLPGTPAATHFPPGYPALLALLWRIFPVFPGNVFVFKAANAVLLAMASAGMVVLAQRRFGFSPLAAAALSVAGCAAIPTLVLSSLVLSEPFFLALLIPILLFAERVVEGMRPVRDLILLGVLAGGATLVRTHGIALTAGVALALVIRTPSRNTAQPEEGGAPLRLRLRDAAVVVACAALVMLPWQLWVNANHGVVPEPMRGLYESYTSWLVRGLNGEGLILLWRTLSRSTLAILGMFATLTTPLAFSWARLLSLISLGALLIAGLRRMWLTAPVTTLFLTVYSGIVMVWPYVPARFIWGVWPLIVLVFVLGAREITSWRPRLPATMAARAALFACSLFVGIGYTRYNTRGYRAHWWSNVARTEAPNIRPVIQWVRGHTRPEDVIASTMDPTVYLYSGRLAVPATAFTVRDYFRPATVAETQAALRQILTAYHVDAIAAVKDSLRVAAQSMASSDVPELVLRDRLPNGLVFAPVPPPTVSQHPAP
jgi:hypothetical protein